MRVSFCVIDSANQMLRCADPDQKPFDVPLGLADNYGCMTPEDWNLVLKDLVKQAPKAKAEIAKMASANPYFKRRYGSVLRPD